jgi:hypothetical protein
VTPERTEAEIILEALKQRHDWNLNYDARKALAALEGEHKVALRLAKAAQDGRDLAEKRLAELEGNLQGAERKLSEATDTLRERDAEVKNLTEALHFYAEQRKHRTREVGVPGWDGGARALKALRAEPAKEPCDYCKTKGREWTPACEDNKELDRQEAAARAEPAKECCCGSLAWTQRQHGRLTHKHACPARTDDFCQTHPKGNCAPI